MRIGLESLIDPKLAAHVEEAREFNLAMGTARGDADFDLRTPEGLRGMRESLVERPAPTGPPPVEVVAEAGGRQVPVRILVPESGTAHGVYLDIHGGGFYMGWAARNDARNRRLADVLGIAVVSVDYRLAPEHPWPAAPDDCETAALWLLEQTEPRFGTVRLAVGAALQFGAWDLSGLTPAGRTIADEYFLEAYVGEVEDRTDPDISPIFGDLSDLPPALIVVGTTDILLEDNLVMAARLSAAGGEVDLRVYPESPHGFTSFPIAMAEAAVGDIESWLAGRLLDT